MQSISLITNNALFSHYSLKNQNADFKFNLLESSALDVFISGRGLIHLGWELLNHPLYGNFRPGEQPFRTLLLCHNGSDDAVSAKSIDFSYKATQANACWQEGLNFIEQAIQWNTPFADKLPVINAQIHEETRKDADGSTPAVSNYYLDCAIMDRELMRKTLEIAGIYIP